MWKISVGIGREGFPILPIPYATIGKWNFANPPPSDSFELFNRLFGKKLTDFGSKKAI